MSGRLVRCASILLLTLRERVRIPFSFVCVVDINEKHTNPIVCSIDSNFAYSTFHNYGLYYKVWVSHVWVQFFESFSRVKSTQDEKVRFSKGMSYKMSATSFCIFTRFNNTKVCIFFLLLLFHVLKLLTLISGVILFVPFKTYLTIHTFKNPLLH